MKLNLSKILTFVFLGAFLGACASGERKTASQDNERVHVGVDVRSQY
jgi:hypothetical protein